MDKIKSVRQRLFDWSSNQLLRLSPLLPVYVGLVVLGQMFVSGSITAVKLTADANEFGGWWWPLALLLASSVATIGAVNLKWIFDARSVLLEAAGSCVLVYVLIAYGLALVGPKAPTYTVYLTFGVALTVWLRCLQLLIILVRQIKQALKEQREAEAA